MATIADRQELATQKAEGAAQILHDVANGDAASSVSTATGDIPTLHRWFAEKDEAVDNLLASVQTSANQTVADSIASVTAEADRAVTEADRAATEANQAATEADRAVSEADRAVMEADRAESARDAAQASGKIYADTAAGLAATTNAQYFSVPSVETAEYLILYRNNAGAALEVKRYPTIAAVDAIVERVPSGVNFMPLSPESGYVAAWLDPVTGRSSMRLAVDGTLELDAVTLPAGSVRYGDLNAELKALTPATLSPETGYVWALVDPVTGRAPVRLGVSGTLEADALQLGAKTVDMTSLADDARRQLAPNPAEMVSVEPDVWRGRMAEVAAVTESDGALWAALSTLKTRHLRGINASGTALEFRRSAGLGILGRKYGGTFSPGSVSSITAKGSLSGPSVSAPSGTFVAGDYYFYVNGSGTVSTGTYAGMNIGDLLVYDGATWVIQPAPGAFGARTRGQWWEVTSAGWFDGVQYAAGDRILYIGRQTGGGGWQYERWAGYKNSDSRLFYRSEFDPAAGLPASYLDGDLFQASAAGSAGGITFAARDYLVRDSGAWGHIPNDPIKSVAAGAFVSLPCVVSATEWEVRRADKSSSVVGVRLKALTQSVMRRNRDEILAISDSMFGVGGVGAAIIAATGRAGTVKSFGGSTSLQVLGMLEYEIAAKGDSFAGRVLLAWHGQNNQPSTEANAAQVRYASLRMAELAGARDARIVFLSILGQRNASWNGTRIVCSQQEDQFAGTGHLHELAQWYEAAFPGRWISTYRTLLAAATNAPDPQFPGMTEQQVAATYGIVPWSFFPRSGGTWNTADLVYRGTWSTADLPTGGAANDYYLRIGGGGSNSVGNLLVNEAGTWMERSIDFTHLNSVGASAMATGGAGFDLGEGYTPIAASTGVAGFLNNNLI